MKQFQLTITVISEDEELLGQIEQDMLNEPPPVDDAYVIVVSSTGVIDVEDGPQHEHLKGQDNA